MNIVTVLVLLAAAWFFMQAEMGFFGFLALVALLIYILSDAFKQPAGGPGATAAYPGYGPNQPQIIVQGDRGMPSNMQLEINPTWGGAMSGEEKLGARFGTFVNFWGRSLSKLFK